MITCVRDSDMAESVFWVDVIEKGRITIPVDERKAWDIEKGDSVHIALREVKKGIAKKEVS